MEWSILFMGPVGAGKTRAIHTLSDIAAAGTEVEATDETALMKQFTTVSMDAGVLDLGSGDKVRLIGAPGQDRFDFMWDILLEQAKAVVIMIDHSRTSRLDDLDKFVSAVQTRAFGRRLPMAVGVTHIDEAATRSLDIYRDKLTSHPPSFASALVPVFPVDAREANDVRALVISVGAMLEMEMRFAART